MGFWSVMKELYKGSKQVMSEVNNGLDKLNAELEAYNAEQRLIRPLKDLKHQIQMSVLSLNSLDMAIPAYAKETRLILEYAGAIFDWLEALLEAGIQDKNGCRDMVLLLADEIQKELGVQQDLLAEFLKDYPLEKLESRGYREDHQEYKTETCIKIDRIKFVYSIDRVKIERDAKNLIDECENTLLTKLNRVTDTLNNSFNLSLLPLKQRKVECD
ncbi:TPA: hypothetical protein ACX6QF_000498 [Photobacterium damselae]